MKRIFVRNKRKEIANLIEFTGNARTEQFEGRDHLVLPGVLVREQVLKGSTGYEEGAGFLPIEEIKNSLFSWNNIPIVVNHTNDSARNRKTLESRGIGWVFDPKIENSSLKADLWFDVAKMEALNESGLLKRLQDGDVIDVSTGYVTDKDIKSGSHNGESYAFIQKNIQPDHLAVLPFDAGACSVRQGCGTNLNMVANILGLARDAQFNGIERLIWRDVNRQVNDYVDGYYTNTNTPRPEESEVPTGVDNMSQEMKNWIANLSLLGDANGLTLKELSFMTVVNPNTGKLNEGALNDIVDPFYFHDEIPDKTLISAISVARGLLKKEFGEETDTTFNRIKNRINGVLNTINSMVGGKSMNKELRTALIAKLAGHASVTLNSEMLETLDCKVLQNMEAMLPVEQKPPAETPTPKPAPTNLNAEAIEKALGIESGQLAKVIAAHNAGETTILNQKTALVAKLVKANNTGLSEAQLNECDIVALNAFDKMGSPNQVSNFGVNGQFLSADDNKVKASPSLADPELWKKG